MVRIRYTIEQRIFIYDNFVKTESVATVRRRFRERFADSAIPNPSSVRDIVKKVRETGSLNDKKTQPRRRVLTEEKLDDIGARLENSPRKSLKRLAQEVGVSKSSARVATKLLNLKSYKTMQVRELQLGDPGSRVNFAVMDVIKAEPEVDPLAVQTSGNNDLEEKKPLREEVNLLNVQLTEIKAECEASEIKFEDTPVPAAVPIVKCEAEEELCDLDTIKQELKLEVATEENEVFTESSDG
ncbi:uncharacterized protein [Periplaneta americana]|uniref:uncharacterized protein isoform X3 n=1 Tax=Periplaneta americana TaxID=6978 RepID=UPI0037E8C524